MDAHIVDFSHFNKDDIVAVGGKAANLGELLNIGIAVPPGAVVMAAAYQKFIAHNEIDIANLLDGVESIQATLAEIRQKIATGCFPHDFIEQYDDFFSRLAPGSRIAVRSSSTAEDLADASFAGQQESYLNVIGKEAVLQRIKDCYASLWSDRAYHYRVAQGYASQPLAIAVVLQQMVESDRAGVLFTRNPTGNGNEIVINAAYGLGESVVSGLVSPDEYICSRAGVVLKTVIGSKNHAVVYAEQGTQTVSVDRAKRRQSVLAQAMIEQLIAVALKIEGHYGCAMDIEWAVRENALYILQARPITTAGNTARIFSLADFKDLPAVKPTNPMTRKIVLFNLEKVPRPYYPLDFDFANLLEKQKLKMLRQMGVAANALTPIDKDGISTFKISGVRPTLSIFKLPKMFLEMKDHRRNTVLSSRSLQDCNAKLQDIKLKPTRSLPEIGERLKAMQQLICDTAYGRFRYAVFPLVIENKRLDKQLKKLDSAYGAFDLVDGLSYVTSDINCAIAKIARSIAVDEVLKNAVMNASYDELIRTHAQLKSTFAEFMAAFGYRSDFNCYCFTAKSWCEDPDRLLNTVRVALRGLTESQTASDCQKSKYDTILSAMKNRLSQSAFDKFVEKCNAVRHYYMIREASQYLWESEFAYCRELLKKAADMLDYNYRDLLYLFADELFVALQRAALGKVELDLIKARKAKRPLAEAYWNHCIAKLLETRDAGIAGVGGSGGSASGKVCVVNGVAQFSKLKKGDILVCPYTDPEWTVLFNLAAAVVVDTGGTLSHAAIVAREYQIPAVLATGDATKRLRDGDVVVVDGTAGKVVLSSRAK